MSSPTTRIIVVWFPDWPLHAWALAHDTTLEEPVALYATHRVAACTLSARHRGIRRSMRLREAQALIPGLTVAELDEDRDARYFEPIVAGLDDVAANVEVIRPGLIACNAAALAKFHGSEEKAAELLVTAASRQGIDCQAGIADELPTAIIAARHGAVGAVIPPQNSVQFLAVQPLDALVADAALGCERDTIATLHDVGVHTLGDLANLPGKSVSSRFGSAGMHAHAIARATPSRGIAPAETGADLSVSLIPEEPIERVDAAAFAARTLSAQLHNRLATAGYVCHRLTIEAIIAGASHQRTWRTREPLTETATADRVRWQLDSWLTSGIRGALTELILNPVEVAIPEYASTLLAANTFADDEAAATVIARVASQLGPDAIVRPVAGTGRGVADRVYLIPAGDEPEPATAGKPVPGRLMGPLPARLGPPATHPAARVVVVDKHGQRVGVNAEALLTAVPHALRWGKKNYLITGWAGPWPVDGRWWDAATPQEGRVARIQVVGKRENHAPETGWVLVWGRGMWRVEAVY